MSNAKKQMIDAIASAKQKRKEQKKFAKLHEVHFKRIAAALQTCEEYLVRINLDASSIDISISGDHHAMKGAWAALRKLGYECGNRPEGDKITSWNGWFNKTDWPQIWFTFTSTKCTRKKVGTKMVETAVYEVVCE